MTSGSRRRFVGHLPEAQAMRWCELAGGTAIARPQDPGHVTGTPFPGPHLHHGADDRTDHLLAERRRLDVEAQHPVAEVHPAGVTDAPDQGGPLDGGSPAERREVVLTVERIAGQPERPEIEWGRHVP